MSTRYTIGDGSEGSPVAGDSPTMMHSAHSRRFVKFAADEEDETVYRVDVDESLYPEQNNKAGAPSAAGSVAQAAGTLTLLTLIIRGLN